MLFCALSFYDFFCILYTNFARFHEFLKLENEIGNITRQEAVSMVGTPHDIHFFCCNFS